MQILKAGALYFTLIFGAGLVLVFSLIALLSPIRDK
jgi:hypothetical protein